MGSKTEAKPSGRKSLRVRAQQLGFYGMRRRRPGDVFLLTHEKHFTARWMVWADDARSTEPVAEPVAEQTGAHVGDLTVI